ncbi:hypothetical protein [Caloramator sp. ALD01]|uniref:hypothetical protein n=1 Tax=Caloramator sp. ALD01 TaxID=1031288 RepID=UPI0003FDF8E9|nr:hypothetical protein [Caloramator sp. ALD01]
MSPEVARLAYRAIIDYMGGDIKRYNNLINEAMRISNIISCPHCRNAMIEGRKGKTKEKIMICTHCGYIEKLKGEEVC